MKAARRNVRSPWRRAAGGLLLAALLAAGGCAPARLAARGTTANPVLWKTYDQFIRIEPQDVAGAARRPNAHPVKFSADQVRRTLAELQVRRAGSEKMLSIFDKSELQQLGPGIAAGLARATPGQDVCFAIIGMHPGAFTLERRVTTGRVFFRDGKLNLIFGRLQARFNEDADRRLHPFLPGSRQATTTPSWQLQTEPGVRLAVRNGRTRPDWLVLKPAPLQAPPPRVQQSPATMASQLEQLREQTATLRANYRKLRQEVESLRGQTAGEKAGGKTIEFRLKRLESLKGQHLLSDREYRQKRQQILNEL